MLEIEGGSTVDTRPVRLAASSDSAVPPRLSQCSEKESELEGRLHELKEAKDVLNSLVASCQEVNTQLELKRRAVLQRRQTERQTADSGGGGGGGLSGKSTDPPTVPAHCPRPSCLN